MKLSTSDLTTTPDKVLMMVLFKGHLEMSSICLLQEVKSRWVLKTHKSMRFLGEALILINKPRRINATPCGLQD